MTHKTMLAAVATILVAVVASAAYAARGSSLLLGSVTHSQQSTFRGFYDGHRDSYLITDVSSKSQAALLHVNFAPVLARATAAPPQYFVRGRAAAGQLVVFGSEPGEADYNPLWDEVFVTWKAGIKPVLLVRDDQIKALASKHELTMSDPHIVLNAPITTVGK
jgi:hypothetical protein